MKSIERSFNKVANKNPLWSSYICFIETIRERKFSERMIRRWFNKLVDKDDYDKAEKRMVVKSIVYLKSG